MTIPQPLTVTGTEVALVKDPTADELIKLIAKDIGDEILAYVEVMYPAAIEATPSTFKISLRNSIYNQIMAAVKVGDAGQITARLEVRKQFRHRWVNAYRKMRGGAAKSKVQK